MKEYTIFHPLFMSFYSKSLYRDVARNWKVKTAFFYLFFLLAVCSVLSLIGLSWAVSAAIKSQFVRQIVVQIPPIWISQGEVITEQAAPYTIEIPQSDYPLAIIDTSGEITSLNDTQALVLLTKSQLLFRRSAFEEPESVDLSKVDEFYIDRDRAHRWLRSAGRYFVIILFPFYLLIAFVYRSVQVLIYAIIGTIFAHFLEAQLSYPALIRLAIIAVTPVLLIDTLFSLFGMVTASMGLSWWGFCFLVAMGYLFFIVNANAEKTL